MEVRIGLVVRRQLSVCLIFQYHRLLAPAALAARTPGEKERGCQVSDDEASNR